ERATSRKACIGAVELLGKVAATWRMPPPRPAIAAQAAMAGRANGCGLPNPAVCGAPAADGIPRSKI
ncbi:hypothetical protein ABV299_11235, partial [Neisseria gonorrhoeae]|uniref:hypothetical protein n=1 Tax=Neisseria gonorrhoeae TaxID=485 RepID=UPI0034E98703